MKNYAHIALLSILSIGLLISPAYAQPEKPPPIPRVPKLDMTKGPLKAPFQRIDNGQATIIDCDFADVLDFRERFMAPNERRLVLKGSFFDMKWLKILQTRGCDNPLRGAKQRKERGRIRRNIALPRIKDFRGLSSKGIDNSYNYSFGIKEHIVFPEVNFDKVDKIRGLDITMVTTSKNKKGTFELLKEFNFPISEKKN